MNLLIMRLWVCFAAIAVCFMAKPAVAQELAPVKGITYNNKIMQRIAQVTITNLQHRSVVISNLIGEFSINAAPGDTLLFQKVGFTEQRLIADVQKPLFVYLVPAIVLDDVVVKTKTRKLEQQEVMDTYRSKGIYYNGKPPATSFLASPLTGFYELFGKGPKRARHFANYIAQENQQVEINKRYTRELVKRITKLPDEEISSFMLAYNPPYKEFVKWNDYELIQFINKSFEGYKQTKGAPPLKSLTEQ